MNSLLVEILTEEIPFSLQNIAYKELKNTFSTQLKEKARENFTIETFATPRRLVLYANNLPNQTTPLSQNKKGPKINAPQAALDGFLKNNNIQLQDCYIKDDYYYYTSTIEAVELTTILPQIIITTLQSIPFAKSMRWNNSNITWARPIRNILALYNNNVLNINFANLTSNNYTFGHRFLANNKKLIIENASNYFSSLENNYVIVNAEQRKITILQAVAKIEKELSLKANLNNANLINEINFLVEYPLALVAEIPSIYMSLPSEVLINVMETHQRYITLNDTNGNLSNKFIIIANNKTATNQEIIEGNIKVLRSRLDDALFFYNNDLKQPLQVFYNELKNITFFEGLGSIQEKTLRVQDLFNKIFGFQEEELFISYKADLATSLVKEITELQGIIGSYYAPYWLTNTNNITAIAQAIKDHYKPQGPNDTLPSTILGAQLSVADKLDTLIEFFKIGKKPTGSKDPFALRRAALGVIRNIIHYELDINLNELISPELADFIKERLIIKLNEDGIKKEIARFSINKHPNVNILNIYNTSSLVQKSLADDNTQAVISIYKRIINIFKSQNINSQNANINIIATNLFYEEVEKDLYNHIIKLAPQLENTNLEQGILLLLPLKDKVDAFLNKISIEATEEISIKNNRVKLLSNAIAIITKILPEEIL